MSAPQCLTPQTIARITKQLQARMDVSDGRLDEYLDRVSEMLDDGDVSEEQQELNLMLFSQQMSEESSKRHGSDSSDENISASRRRFLKRGAGLTALGAFSYAAYNGAAPAWGMALDGVEKTGQWSEAYINAPNEATYHLDNAAVKAVDSIATLKFLEKVTNIGLGREDGVTKKDYAWAIGLNVARCVVGGTEVTKHTMHEHAFGFSSAALAIGLGFACEGITADVDEMLDIMLGDNPTQSDKVAAITAMASALSPTSMTISSCGALGAAIRDVCWDEKTGQTHEQALSVLMGHVGDHSALVSLLWADPPDIPFFKQVGWKTGVLLKAQYGIVPAMYSFLAANVKVNTVLNGGDKSKAIKDSLESIKKIMPFIPSFWGNSIKNVGLYMAGKEQNPKGVSVDILGRLSEALNNAIEIMAAKNPLCRHEYAHHHGYVSELVQQLSEGLTTYAGCKMDSRVEQMMEVLDRRAADNQALASENKRIMALVKAAMSASDPEVCDAMFKSAVDQVDKTFEADEIKHKQIKAYIGLLWEMHHELNLYLSSRDNYERPDNPVAIARMVARLTDTERLANAFGHEQMDVVTLLPWQLLMAVPGSAMLQWALDVMEKAKFSKNTSGAFNMGLTGVVTGLVDNLAAYLVASGAAIRGGKPHLMQALNASIVFGSGTWLGNPVAHGKVASGTVPAAAKGADSTCYGPGESMRFSNMKMNADVYAVTVIWTLTLDHMGVEENTFKASGQTHPALQSQGNQEHHAMNDNASKSALPERFQRFLYG